MTEKGRPRDTGNEHFFKNILSTFFIKGKRNAIKISRHPVKLHFARSQKLIFSPPSL